jgi:hypothetical protein
MTKREACERIVQDGDCLVVSCSSCPLWGEWECLGRDEVVLARAWLVAHPSDCEYCTGVDRTPLIAGGGMYVEVAGDELRVFGSEHYECGIQYCPMCGRKL